MEQVLVYSDSLSWGIVPNTRQRLAFDRRWPGVTEAVLVSRGQQVRIVENCLNGRRTVWDDPFLPGRSGLCGLGQVIEMHSPLAAVVLMLGTNDFQSMHPHNAWHSARGMAALIAEVRRAPIEPSMSIPPVLVVAPPPIVAPKGPIAPKFAGGEKKCVGLSSELERVAAEMDCAFLDAGKVTPASVVDGIHLDEGQHRVLGEAVAGALEELLG